MAEQVLPDAPVHDSATELAVARTLAAYERTMMSWIRTATSLITFGFTIYKFFQIEAPPHEPVRLIGPRDFAAMLVSIGLVTLLLGILEYRYNIQALGGHHGGRQHSLAVITAALVFIVGVLGLLAVIFRQ